MEEVTLLRAESERVGKTFGWLEDEWRRKGILWEAEEGAQLPRGVLAYAARQMSTFRTLRRAADQKFLELTRIK